MHTSTIVWSAAVALTAIVGCCKSKSEETTGAATTATAPTATTAPAGEKRFEGSYSSNWGTTTFTEEGGTVRAVYPRGTVTCQASGDVLSCDWVEGSMRGKAHLVRQPNGDISGTWGNGSSATDGGPWAFRKSGGTAPGGSAADFNGAYKSTWGTTTFTQTGDRVSAKYPRGTMSCVATGNVLNCDWFEGSSRGKARLTKRADGIIGGTWGNGSSASNGGPWHFTPM